MTLHPDFKEFIELLNKHEADYLLIGGYAVVFYGYVRATGDMDIWIRNTIGNAKKVWRALSEFGFQFKELSPNDLTEDNLILQLGYPPFRIDILTTP